VNEEAMAHWRAVEPNNKQQIQKTTDAANGRAAFAGPL